MRSLKLAGQLVALAAVAGMLGLLIWRLTHQAHAPKIGKDAPAFTLKRIDGAGKLSLASLRGRPVVVNFWASWCIPCKQENPALVKVYERYRTSDVVFVGVLYQDSADGGLTYLKDNGVVWPTVNDDQGRVAFSYGVFGIPETYFIGRDGVIAGRHIGPIDETTLINGIEAMRTKAKQ
jgi:cytochrome c biogenesis protein CcmG/thiol:disulfide interchange protein DsbE